MTFSIRGRAADLWSSHTQKLKSQRCTHTHARGVPNTTKALMIGVVSCWEIEERGRHSFWHCFSLCQQVWRVLRLELLARLCPLLNNLSFPRHGLRGRSRVFTRLLLKFRDKNKQKRLSSMSPEVCLIAYCMWRLTSCQPFFFPPSERKVTLNVVDVTAVFKRAIRRAADTHFHSRVSCNVARR